MLKIVFIDDDESIVEGLKYILDWNSLDIEIAGVAYSGQEGLELIDRTSPHLVVTDIRMPQLDGLSMLAALNHKNVKTIILSGYDDFHYAQSAIEKGAFAYLLKPLKKAELLEKIQSAITLIKEELAADQSTKHLTLLAKEKYLLDLLTHTQAFANSTSHHHLLALQPHSKYYEILILEPQEHLLETTSQAFEDLNHYVTQKNNDLLAPYTNNLLVVFIQGTSTSHLKTKREELLDYMDCLFTTPISIGVSSSFTDLNQIHLFFEEAQHALDETFQSVSHFVQFNSDEAAASLKSIDTRPYIESIISQVKDLNLTGTYGHIEKLFNYLIGQKCSSNQIYTETISLLVYLKNLAYSYNLQDNIFSNYEIYRVTYLRKNYKTAPELKTWLTDCISDLINQIKTSSSSTELLIEQIKQYVVDQNGLTSREAVASHFHMNASYLSRLFKQQSDMSFIDYVTQVKLDKAKRLLSNSSLQIQEISDQLGYTNAQYFSTVFEKHIGITPTKYRKNLKSKS